MFKIGERYRHHGELCTVHSLTADRWGCMIKYDNSTLGHDGLNCDYHYDDNGKPINFVNNKTGYYFVTSLTPGLIPVKSINDYEIY